MVSMFLLGGICCVLAFLFSQLAFWSTRASERLVDDYHAQWQTHYRLQEQIEAAHRRQEREARANALGQTAPVVKNKKVKVVDRQSKPIPEKTVIEPPKMIPPEEYFDVTRE